MRHVVGIADLKVGTRGDDEIVTYALGSCLGICAWDPVAGVGGLIHVMLPVSKQNPALAQEKPLSFVDTGLPRLVKGMTALGAHMSRMEFVVVGGASMMEGKLDSFDVGQRNYMVFQNLERNLRLHVRGRDVGGTIPRTVRLSLATGAVKVSRPAGELAL